MNVSLQNEWVKKSRWFLQMLIISGALNVGSFTALFYISFHEGKKELSFDMKPSEKRKERVHNEFLSRLASLSFEELLLLLKHRKLLEDGYRVQDFALTALATFHHIDVDRALCSFPLQKRELYASMKGSTEPVKMRFYPGFTQEHFDTLLRFIEIEEIPWTTEGLFLRLKKGEASLNASLVDAFSLSSEYLLVRALFQRAKLFLPREIIVALLLQGDWDILERFFQSQKASHDFSQRALSELLHQYVSSRSKIAAQILLEWDKDYILNYFDNEELIYFFRLIPPDRPSFLAFLKEIICRPRSDEVWQKAARILFESAAIPFPDPYDHEFALATFGLPNSASSPTPPIPSTSSIKHRVAPGENLWKIALHYKTSISKLKKINHLTSDRIYPGTELLISEEVSLR